MITNEEKEGWHYLAVKKLSALLHKKNFDSSGYFYCLNCLNSFMTENKLKIHKKISKNYDFCGVEMLSEKNNILKFSQHEKLNKMPYIIYADLECLVKRIKGCEKNPEISSTTKVGEHIPCGYSMSTMWRFNHTKNKHTLYRGKDCMKKLCKSLTEHAQRIIGFEKKKNVTFNKQRVKITRRC